VFVCVDTARAKARSGGFLLVIRAFRSHRIAMRMSPPAAFVLSSILFATASFAQPPPPAPKPAAPKPAAPAAPLPGAPKPGAPGAPKPGAPPVAGAPTPPPDAPPAFPPPLPQVDVTDPGLGPVPQAHRMLAGWREALQLIAARSVDLVIAQQEVERAAGQSRQALALALPTITATGSITQGIIPNAARDLGGGLTAPAASNAPSALASLTARQPIFDLRSWYGIKTAELGVTAAKQTVEDKRRTILVQVADAIVAVFTTERVAEINRLGLRNALQHQNLAERKARLGDGTRLDVLRAQQDAAAARSTLITGDESLLKAREALGLALGSQEGWGVPPSISLDEMQQSMASICAAGTVDDRPDIAAARTALEVANRGITDSKLAFSPTASVISTTSASSDVLGNGRQVSWSIQGLLTVPLWEGGARYGSMRIARVNVEEARIKLDAARRGATLDVTQANRSVLVADQARAVAEQARDLAREAARLAERAFVAGAGTSFDLVDASRQERAAELNLALAEFDLVKAKIASLLATANCSY
jgi:outer membrane protein TolC